MQRQPARAGAREARERIRDRGRDGRDRRLADAADRRLRRVQQQHVDRRRVREPEQPVAVEVRLHDAAVAQPDAFVERGAEAHQDPALDLRVHEIRVHDGAAVERARDPSDAQAAVRWFRANASTYGVDPTRIGIGGSSAGAVTSVEAGAAGLVSGTRATEGARALGGT